MNFREFAAKNVFRNMRAYFGYFLSSTVSAALLFSFTMLVLHPDLDLSDYAGYLQQGFKVTTVIAYVFLCFFIFYSVSVFLRSRFKEFGILYILGTSNRQLKRMIGIENIIISSASGIVGVILGLVFSKIFLLATGKVLGYETLKFYLPIKAIFLTTISFIVMGIVISLFSSSMIKENKVLDLLKGSKKPKVEPKASIMLVILCVLLLAGGYCFSATSTVNNIIYRIVPVTIVVVIGTYLLFSQFSVYIIKALKKKRNFYMKKTNVLWVSNLLYRIKDNTRMLFLITITSSVAFTSIGGVTTFWINKEKEVNSSFPQAFFYESKSIDNNVVEFLEDSLKNKELSYNKVIGEIKAIEIEGIEIPINIISDETYNNLARSLGKKVIEVNSNEAIIESSINNIDLKEIKSSGKSLSVSYKLDEQVIPAHHVNTYIVNKEFFNEINGTRTSFYSFDVDNFKDTLDICDKLEEIFNFDGYNTMNVKARMLENSKLAYEIVMFLTIFIGIIFFVTTGSFLYNKCYMDVEEDKEKYKKLNKIGLTFKEIKKTVTIEIGAIFLLPYIVSVIHSIFALYALKSAFKAEITSAAFIVMGSFLLLQIAYYLIIRANYLLELKKGLS